MKKDISNVAFVVQARLNSQRLNRKMIKSFDDSCLFEILLKKIAKSSLIPDENVYLSIYEEELKDIGRNFNFNIFERSFESANEDNDIKVIYEWWDKIPQEYVILISACNPLLKIDTIESFTQDFLESKDHGSFAVFEKKTYFWNTEGDAYVEDNGHAEHRLPAGEDSEGAAGVDEEVLQRLRCDDKELNGSREAFAQPQRRGEVATQRVVPRPPRRG